MEQILKNVRIIDAGTVLAAPGASALLGDFGAEIIKIEKPRVGDALRTFDPRIDGHGLTSKVTNRGKRSVTLDLSKPHGRDIFLELVAVSDAVITNYRLPTVQKWGIDYEDLKKFRDDIVMLHLTGYGRTGPYSDRPGFARVSEAYIGLTHTTGYPDRPPVPSGYAIADAMGGVYGAFSIMLALFERQFSGSGQLIDLALYEPLAKTMDAMYVGALAGQEVPERTGTSNPTIAPHDIYRMGDGIHVSLPVSTQNMFVRLCNMLEVPELVTDPRFSTNQNRLTNRATLDDILQKKFTHISAADFLAKANEAGIAACRINDPLTFTQDPHVQQRDLFEALWDQGLGRTITMQGIVPKLSRTPGTLTAPGEELGASTDQVLADLLSLDDDRLHELRTQNII